MKYLFYFLGFGLMIWALIEQTKDQPNIFIQMAAVLVFFYIMMRLMNKTPSNFKEDSNSEEDEPIN
ncbi:MAG TPA: hypothetical protein VKY33_04905 [Flavobacterium sp.]|nr:hypothetical protein [Flavobacterium sp.]